jgi:glycosyltransferase involved in cell wall biosynthesis
MTGVKNPYAHLSDNSLFLVWGPPAVGPRSRVFARELGIRELHYVHLATRRGLLTAPLRYLYQAYQTLHLLFSKRPQIVFVQSPPSLAVLFVYLYCALTRNQYLIDAHSAAFLRPYWRRPEWLHAFLARRALATIVTNNHFQDMLQRWGATSLIIRDIPTNFPRATNIAVNGEFKVVFINTYSPDEPLEEVIQAAGSLEGVKVYITGKKSKASPGLLTSAPANVHFTDFLPDQAYYGLLDACDAVMCLTTQDHTMQRGACEALSLGKPIITSIWPILKDYFHQGTVHVANDSRSIGEGVMEMKKHYSRYKTEIARLQNAQHREWLGKVQALTEIVEKSLAA